MKTLFPKVLNSTTLLIKLATAFCLVAPLSLPSQIPTPPPARPTFEVASVRLGTPGSPSSFSAPGAAQFTATNISLAVLISMAYGLDGDYQFAGKPGWLDSQTYDVFAKPEAGQPPLSYQQFKPLLQELLQQRFHLAVHRETRDLPGYALTVAKGGPKLQPGSGATEQIYILPNGIRGQALPLPLFAALLSRPVGRPVADRTNIQGNYNIRLEYAPTTATDSELPSIFTALQEQLGLRLEPQKVPVEMLIIDHADRIPTEN
jgi:uncharacterized protein (TIGR03435 family)